MLFHQLARRSSRRCSHQQQQQQLLGPYKMEALPLPLLLLRRSKLADTFGLKRSTRETLRIGANIDVV